MDLGTQTVHSTNTFTNGKTLVEGLSVVDLIQRNSSLRMFEHIW